MNKLNVWVVAGALAIALGISYAGCALAYALWPDATIAFVNAWFHGLDIGMLKTTKVFTFGQFLYGLMGVMASAFIVGVIFGFVYNWLTLLAGGPAGVTRPNPQPH